MRYKLGRMSVPPCKGCDYFITVPADNTAGFCHRYPPVLSNHWPQVPASGPDSGCGEFRHTGPATETRRHR